MANKAAEDILFEKKLQSYKAAPKPPVVKELPDDLSAFELPRVVDYFKMLAIINHGTPLGWQELRDDFIKQSRQTNSQGQVSQPAAILQDTLANNPMTEEDMLMNEFSFSSNDVIQQMNRGTVNNDDGAEKLEKQQIVEGNMPGQGKEKQGNWRG
jgi:hypothetical protein